MSAGELKILSVANIARALREEYGVKAAILILVGEEEMRLGISGTASTRELREALCATIELTYQPVKDE